MRWEEKPLVVYSLVILVNFHRLCSTPWLYTEGRNTTLLPLDVFSEGPGVSQHHPLLCTANKTEASEPVSPGAKADSNYEKKA